MKNSKNIIVGLVAIIILLTSVLIAQIVKTNKYAQENEALKEEQYVEYLDLLTKYSDARVKVVCAEERVKWLENQDHNIENIVSDLDDLMEWTIRYYEVESQTLRDELELWEYILLKDNKLYERILNQWQ